MVLGIAHSLNKKSLIILLVLFVSPLIGLLFIGGEIVKGRNWKLLPYLALVMGLCAMLTPPGGDMFVWVQVYRSYLNSTDTTLIHGEQDYVLYSLCHLFARSGISFEFIRGIFVFIGYQVAFSLFKELLNDRPVLNEKRFSLLLFACFFLIVPFIWIVMGLRSATSCYIMIFAWLSFYRHNYVVGVIWALLSCFTHFFSWIFIPFLAVWPFVSKIRIKHSWFIVVLVLLLIAGKTVFAGILESMSSDSLQSMGASSSTISYYSGDIDTTTSVNGMIAMIMERAPLILLVFYVIFSPKMWRTNAERNFAYLLVWLLAVLVFYYIPIQRISWLVGPILMFLVLKNKQEVFLRRSLCMLFISTLILQFAYMYGYRNLLLSTPFSYLFYPMPVSLLHTYPLWYKVPL